MMKTVLWRPMADDVDGHADKFSRPVKFSAAKAALVLVLAALVSGCTGGITGRVAETQDVAFSEGLIGTVTLSYPELRGNWTMEQWTRYNCGMCSHGYAWHPLFSVNISCGGSSCNCYTGLEYSIEVLDTGLAGNRTDKCEIMLNGAPLYYHCDNLSCGRMNIANATTLNGTVYGARIDENNTITACCLNSCQSATVETPCGRGSPY